MTKREFDLLEPPPPRLPPPPAGAWQKLVRLYGAADPRSLGLLRVALGALLVADVASKFPEVGAHFSNSGWLTNHFALFRPMSDYLFSVYFAFGSPLEVKLLMSAHLLVGLLLLVGYRTKLMQILALLLTTSLNSRNLLLESGGSVALNLLLVWTAFLPLGKRFSVDALRESWRARRETSAPALNDRDDPPRDAAPVVSLAVTAVILQWAAIYALSAVHKDGPAWRDGTALHYFLQQDRLVTWFGAWLRGALPLSGVKALSYGALLVEGAVAALLLLPWRPRLTRMLAFGLALSLHAFVDAVLRLGSFPWVMVVAFCAFVPAEAWGWLTLRFRRRRAPCVVHFDPSSGAALWLCRLVKRLDALGLVTFRALDEASPRKARRTLVVSVAGRKSESGFAALRAVADALWFGSLPLRALGALGLRRPVERRLAQMAGDPAALDADVGTAHLAAEDDARAPEATPARLLWRRLRDGAREAAVAFLLVVCATQLLLENEAVPSQLQPRARPRFFEAVVTYPRIFQGWSRFTPQPPLGDGRLVIDGRTKDGRHLDPLTGRAPVFEVQPAGAPRANLIWSSFHQRIVEDRYRTYWGGVRDFVMNHHKLTGRSNDALASFDAYYVSETFAPPGARKPAPEKRKLFSSTWIPSAPAPAVRPQGKPVEAGAQ